MIDTWFKYIKKIHLMYSILNKNIYNFDKINFQMNIAVMSKIIIYFNIINQTIVV